MINDSLFTNILLVYNFLIYISNLYYPKFYKKKIIYLCIRIPYTLVFIFNFLYLYNFPPIIILFENIRKTTSESNTKLFSSS